MEYLLTTLEYHARNPFVLVARASPMASDTIDTDTIHDVLIKLIRVIANMSVNAEVGYGLGGRPQLGTILLALLLTINKCKTNLVSFFIYQRIIIMHRSIFFILIHMHIYIILFALCRPLTWKNCC